MTPRPVDSEEKSEDKEPSKPINIIPVPYEVPRSAEPTIAADVVEPSSQFAERTNVNNVSTTTKKKKAPMIKKKKKTNLQPLISLHVPPYSMVDDIKNQQARITFRQLLEVAPKCRSDSAAGSIVSYQLLKDLKISIDRPSTTMMINVNGKRKRPLGEVLNFSITIWDITILINVVVTEVESYAAIVETDWLSKVRAIIDYENATMNITWKKQTISIPIEY
ncbi:hypothetical protein RhiirC2_721113 [Rhizophagus irregularis]|uniref:Uncharacterized protein n=1 Tax=Rhizophagus irregularis TaxID=588596 RepID=A0A2N1M7J1_9GLOM|nr:hypothetical protein RhiirC2_721113 [Rhizophagus irregularis]